MVSVRVHLFPWCAGSAFGKRDLRPERLKKRGIPRCIPLVDRDVDAASSTKPTTKSRLTHTFQFCSHSMHATRYNSAPPQSAPSATINPWVVDTAMETDPSTSRSPPAACATTRVLRDDGVTGRRNSAASVGTRRHPRQCRDASSWPVPNIWFSILPVVDG